jgi:hypothetical protein
MLFLHQYGSTNLTYNWYPADGCGGPNKPDYMCVAGLDPNYHDKYVAIKSALESISNTPQFPCQLEVVDAMPYSQDQDPTVPCTGILRGYNDPARVVGNVSGAVNWAWEMTAFMTRSIQLAAETQPDGLVTNAFRTAIDIALCKEFRGSKCEDNDGRNST